MAMSESGITRVHEEHGNEPDLESVKTQLEQKLATFPAESLVEYKSISKFWYNLINCPEFVHMQLRCSRADMVYIICPYTPRNDFRDVYLMDRYNGDIVKTITFPDSNYRFSLHLVSSFNGLLCFKNETERGDFDIWICNPITKNVFTLPRGSTSIVRPEIGVAYDSDSGHYKVFRFIKDTIASEDARKCEVYSSRTGLWKDIGKVECDLLCSRSHQGKHIYIGGRVYWFSMSRTGPQAPIGILSVDMKEENFVRVSFPHDVKANSFLFMIDLDGCLSLLTVRRTHVDIWVLEDIEQSKWAHKTSFELQVYQCIVDIHSVVAIRNEIFFIINDMYWVLHYHVYLLDEDYWRILNVPFRSNWERHVALPFAGSLYPCKGIN